MSICDSAEDGSATRRGRPALDSATREALIFDALEHVMAKAGLRGTTMSAVARAAGMSKRTVYTLYDSRDALFVAWMGRIRMMLARPLSDNDRALPLRDRLRLLLRWEAHQCLSERRMAVLRALVAEAPTYPDIAKRVVEGGGQAARCLVAKELRWATKAGEIAVADIDVAAEILFDMAHKNPLEELISPEVGASAPEAAEARLTQAIDIFLDGVAL